MFQFNAMAKPLLFVHASNELYGSDVILLELVRRLDRSRYVPFVVMPRDLPYEGRLAAALDRAGIANTTVNMAVARRRYLTPRSLLGFLSRLLEGTFVLRRLMRAQGTGLVHSNTSAVWCGALASGLMGIPHVWHVHEIVQDPWVVRRLLASLMAWRGDRVVAISRAVRDHLLRDAPSLGERVVIIPDAVDPERFHPGNDGERVRAEWTVGTGEIVFGVVGRVSSRKGQDDFLDAAALVLRKVPQARFAIVGDAVPGREEPGHALRDRAARLGIQDRVIWAGYREDIPQVMAALDVLVLPSAAPESFGIVLLEAMATSRAVIATAHGGPAEIVVPGETGLLVPPRAPLELAEAMGRLAREPSLRCDLGNAGRARVLSRYTLNGHVAAFEQLYDEMMRAKTD